MAGAGTAAAAAAPAGRGSGQTDPGPGSLVLTPRDLNRAMLARQLLLERADLSITAALERVAGLQTQYSPSGYIGLWARLRDFRREALTAALEEHRVIQATLMRSTIHMVAAADYWPFARGTMAARREWWLRTRGTELGGRDADAACRLVREQLHSHPLPAAEILRILEAHGFSRGDWNGVSTGVEMVRVPPSGTWARRRADRYGLAEEWVAASQASEDEGRERLVARYLGGFGPAPLADVGSWAGVPVAMLRPVLERLELVRYRDERGRELLDLPGMPLPGADAVAPVRLLPVWETALLAHARRTDVLPERYRPIVFNTKTPHSVNTLLVDGQVAGTWRFAKGRVVVEPFDRLGPVEARAVQAEAERLADFHGE